MTDPGHLRALRDLAADLDARLAAVAGDLEGLRADRRTDNADDEHDPEGGTLSSEWSRLQGVHDALADERADVDAALARWAEGTYGVCVDCGRPIPEGRLQVRPTALRCVACAEAAGG